MKKPKNSSPEFARDKIKGNDKGGGNGNGTVNDNWNGNRRSNGRGNDNRKNNIQCQTCDRIGHTTEDCRACKQCGKVHPGECRRATKKDKTAAKGLGEVNMGDANMETIALPVELKDR